MSPRRPWRAKIAPSSPACRTPKAPLLLPWTGGGPDRPGRTNNKWSSLVALDPLALDRRTLLAGLAAGLALIPTFSAPLRAEAPNQDELFSEMVLGDEKAPITILAYESMTCPHCANFHKTTLPQLKKEYLDTGKAKLVFRDFPLDQVSLRAHMMARCGGKGRYFGLVEVIFRTQENWARNSNPVAALAGIGRMSGISDKEFETCLNNKELFDFIVGRIKEGRDKYEVQSTPTFIINGKKAVVGYQPFETFDKVLKPLVE